MSVYSLFNFDDASTLAQDSTPLQGIQLGSYINGATSLGGRAILDGVNDLVKISADPAFQSDAGTLEIQFTLAGAPLTATQTVVSRDSVGDTQGGFRVAILANGAVQVSHETGMGVEVSTTEPGFAAPGQQVTLTCSWDLGGTGGQLNISNLTSGDDFSAPVSSDVTMDMGAANQPYIIGAGQSNSTPDILNNIDQHFAGSVETFCLSNTVDNNTSDGPDGIVSGTSGDDLINTVYTGYPDGDRIVNNEALIAGDGPQDDRVIAGDGDDTVIANLGDDSVEGADGADWLNGCAGVDSLYGQEGEDRMSGGNDRDVVLVANAGDVVDGNEGGDDYDTLDLRGSGPRNINYDAGTNNEHGTVEFLDADRNATGSMTFVNIENVIPCFTPGTMIATPRGEVPVQSLRAGDKVITRDNGLQEIRWTGAKALNWVDLAANPRMKPVLVKAGSLGNGLPEWDMMVSPNHRLLVANDQTAVYFDEHEVLVEAKHLVGSKGMHSVDTAGVTYIHFMFDRHEVVLSNGAWTESFQPGDYTMKCMGDAQRREILDLFPDLKTVDGIENYEAARRTLKCHEALLLVK
jgi:hypothetical protein